MEAINWTKGIDQKTGLPIDYDPKKDIQVYSGLQNQTMTERTKKLCPSHEGGRIWTPLQLQTAEGLRTLGARLQRLHAIAPPTGLAAFDPVSIAAGRRQAILERDPAAAAEVDTLVARTQQLAVDCAAFAATPVTTHGDLNASNLIGPLPMLVDWEYAQLADPVYDLACLSVYYPGLRLRAGELLGAAGITDANATVRLGLHAELFESLNRLWEQAQASRRASE
jgi:aminoglycoside phosphotransferase (APT) family kinase protein